MKNHTTSYQGYRFPPEIISHSIWLQLTFPIEDIDREEMVDIDDTSFNKEPTDA